MNKNDYEQTILNQAKSILANRLSDAGSVITCWEDLLFYVKLSYALLEHEQFGCVFLNKHMTVISHSPMFRGGIDHCEVLPREIARTALLQNASFVVLIHNHPTHQPNPSQTDIETTLQLKVVLAAVDIQLYDHIVVAGDNCYSMRGSGDIC